MVPISPQTRPTIWPRRRTGMENRIRSSIGSQWWQWRDSMGRAERASYGDVGTALYTSAVVLGRSVVSWKDSGRVAARHFDLRKGG